MMKEDRIELYYRSIITISFVIDLIVTVHFLSHGTIIVFQNIYYFTIILVSYRYQWRGAYFSAGLSVAYLLLHAYYNQQFDPLSQAIIRTVIFILVGVVVAYISIRLAQEKKRYHAIFSTTGSGMIAVIGNDHTIVESNSRFLEISGEESAEGKSINAYFERDDMEKLIDSLGDVNTSEGIEMKMTLRTGEKRDCIVTGTHLGPEERVLSIVDIADLKQIGRASCRERV